MRELVTSIRRARPSDAEGLCLVHDAAWREAYRGIIPGAILERMISRRGPDWWRDQTVRGARAIRRKVLVLEIGQRVGGYVIYGPNRNMSLPQRGEIDALYVDPVCHGLGLGGRIFRAARRDLSTQGMSPTIVWCLDSNERGCAFYSAIGGTPHARSSLSIGGVAFSRTGFIFI